MKPSRSQTGSEKSSSVTERDSGDLVKNPIGGKREGSVGKAAVLPAADTAGLAAHGRRIERVEFARQVAIDVGRQLALQTSVGPPGRNTLWPSSMRGGASRNCPATAMATIATAAAQARPRALTSPLKMTTAADQQQRVSCRNSIDRQADRGERQQQRRQLAPAGKAGDAIVRAAVIMRARAQPIRPCVACRFGSNPCRARPKPVFLAGL